MRTPKRWSVSILLLASVVPVFSYAGSSGPKSWFHFPQASSARPQHQGNHPTVKHFVANHTKPHRTRNLHPRISKWNRPS
jgi:hypothetical protein